MLRVRKSRDRGHAQHGWLDSYHTFSFADYYDPNFMGFSVLRVINDDRIQGGAGFPTHPHRDMEIITYVIEGELAHADTLGNKSTIKPGDVQRMSAGTGIRHSEFNALPDQVTRLLQIWILPEKQGIAPGYEQKSIADKLETEELVLAASREGRDGSIRLYQDVDLYAAKSRGPHEWNFSLRPGRHAWLQMVSGQLETSGHVLEIGDGLAAMDEQELKLSSQKDTEFLLFDLP